MKTYAATSELQPQTTYHIIIYMLLIKLIIRSPFLRVKIYKTYLMLVNNHAHVILYY